MTNRFTRHNPRIERRSRRFAASVHLLSSWLADAWSGGSSDIFPRDVIPTRRSNPSGTDPEALRIRRTSAGFALDVVIGPLFGPVPDLDRRAAGDPPRLRIHRDVNDLSGLMSTVDLAVSGRGQTLYELAATRRADRCALPGRQPGAEHRRPRGGLAALGGPAARNGGGWIPRHRGGMPAAGGRRALRQRMSDAGRSLIDGQGAARVTEAILRSGRR